MRQIFTLGVFLKEVLIGRISVRNFHFFQQDAQKKSVFLSFWISPEFSGKGFATELLEEICRFVFEDLGMHKIFAGVFWGEYRFSKSFGKGWISENWSFEKTLL